ncbi:MAG TPA: GFA family protein, partial [Rhizomicrobium sp.]|nr:GFA family protein [Rhizomicrobium sp.]
MKVHGQCHCGELVYEAEVDPALASICHCTDCQILTGTAYRVSVPARAENFRILNGEPKIYVKTAESGNPRAQAFCPTCGTPIYASDVKHPQLFNLRTGPLAERAELKPQRQIWCRSA